MSRTYIGPFGRILPVLDNSSDGDSSGTEGQGPPIQDSQSNMTTYQLPPPQIPLGLEFGSDPRPGFSEPKNYDISSQSRRAVEQQRQTFDEPRRSYNIQHGQLPSLSQLLTPGSQSTGATSPPYASHQNPTSPENRSEGSSPRQPNFRDPPPQAAAVPYQNAYSAVPYQHPSRDNLLPRSPRYAGPPAMPPYAMPMQPVYDPGMNSYPHASISQPRLYSSYPQQPPHPTAMAAPTQNSSSQPGLYEYPSNSGPRSNQPTGNAAQSVKPLPRVVGEQDVPGEGPCWIYEDGSVCKKVIDGELVNAQWGVTKAGKPRKRLAIACTTCREKKIKCDPAEGKCLQCEKFGRECRFTTA
ncbi:MAG: hypothetical protein L6R42_009503 [Xanthoria sp. 1 TBL-2021]|nr:MAG: hypothetical protein L6R42_009503 [Xanthoria sp. 1 TBL-2021]